MFIYGVNPVREAILKNFPVLKLYVSETFKKKDILGLAEERGIKVSKVSKKKLEEISGTKKHQGIVAVVSPVEPVDFFELVENAVSTNGVILFLDHIEDPRNLGAIFRSACAFDVSGIVLPKDRSVLITPAVVKSSSGGVFCVPFSIVSSFSKALEEFKERGGWLIGFDINGKPLAEFSFPFPLGVVFGAEGKGLSRSAKGFLDDTVSIETSGKIDSLNVSTAVGIGLYLVFKQKRR